MPGVFKKRPLLLAQIRVKVSMSGFRGDKPSLTVDLAEIFYEFWRGEGLFREFLDSQNKKEVIRVLVDLQILLEHLKGHIGEAVEGVNVITEMHRTKKRR